ncbi:MAG: hypothetical protein HYZ62_00195 [Candidatus Andersenbacteria bacterium]|nr:hypothetical protein [Candidatus Andersenbacteria bacterium]
MDCLVDADVRRAYFLGAFWFFENKQYLPNLLCRKGGHVPDSTYWQLCRDIEGLPRRQRQQPAQVMLSWASDSEPAELLPVLRLASVMELGVENSRSSFDGKHHADSMVLVVGLSPFSIDGDVVAGLVVDPPYTYQRLLDDMNGLLSELARQPVQVFYNPDFEGWPGLLPLVAFGSLAYLEVDKSRSSYDNEHHPDDIVLFLDMNAFGDDGSIGWDMMTGESVFPEELDEPDDLDAPEGY